LLLTMTRPNRAALTFQDLSSDTKFGPSQSHETLPLKGWKFSFTVIVTKATRQKKSANTRGFTSLEGYYQSNV